VSENLQQLVDLLPQLGEGVLVTLELTLGGAVLALLIAFTLGFGSRARTKWARVPSRVVVEFLRGTSLVVQIFWLYYVLPLPPFYVELDPLACGILALGLNYGAYASEVVRGSINSVAKGQWEAAVALDLGPVHRMRRVIMPQAWPLMIPMFTNLLIQLVKGSALAAYISLHDLNFFTEELRERTSETVFSYTVGLILYLPAHAGHERPRGAGQEPAGRGTVAPRGPAHGTRADDRRRRYRNRGGCAEGR
jgi:polar amino acid transport system permease protein